MLLTLSTTHRPATDLGYLLRKNPARAQSFELSFGKAHVFHPEASELGCTVALPVEVDPVGLVRNRRGPAGEGGLLEHYDRFPTLQKERLKLLHVSLMYRDERLAGFDAAAVVEVIEHLDPPRLAAFERVLFECAHPGTVVLTTPNREYNVKWETLPPGKFRHRDHRFEWTRAEFQDWANRIAEHFGYRVRFLPVGPEDSTVGAPTQMGVFEKIAR